MASRVGAAGVAARSGAPGPFASFLEAGVPLHAVLADGASRATPRISPTPFLTRVLRRTVEDFADALVDARCSTGSSSTTGTATAIWAHAASRDPRGTGAKGEGAACPLFLTPPAVREVQQLLFLYGAHCLLTEMAKSSTSSCRPDVVLIVARSAESAKMLREWAAPLAEHCGISLSASLQAFGWPLPSAAPPAAASSPLASTAAASMVLLIVSMDDFLQWELNGVLGCPAALSSTVSQTASPADVVVETTSSAAAPPLEEEGAKEEEEEGGEPAPTHATTTTTAAAPIEATSATSPPLPPPRLLAVIVEDISLCAKVADAAEWSRQLAALHVALQQAERRAAAQQTSTSGYVPFSGPPRHLWVCRGPLSALPWCLRECLNRQNRRYYPLTFTDVATTAPPSWRQLLPPPLVGPTVPLDSMRLSLVMSLDEVDKEAQLRRLLTDRANRCRRILLLTHSKEVPQLSARLESWGFKGQVTGDGSARMASSPQEGAGDAATLKGGTDDHDSISETRSVYPLRRTDSREGHQRIRSMFLTRCDSCAREATALPSVLVAWDAFTAVDIMDVDMVIAVYPPQKSLTDEEWRQHIQVLHTTGNTEQAIELQLEAQYLRSSTRRNGEAGGSEIVRRRMLQLRDGLEWPMTDDSSTSSSPCPSSPSTLQKRSAEERPTPVLVSMVSRSDFKLATHFLLQYLYSGGTGVLTAAANSASLSSWASPSGQPGIVEPTAGPLPVLNIAPDHPYFIPLVCGGVSAAAEAAPRDAAAVPSITQLTCGQPVTVTSVLLAKFRKEAVAAGGQRGGAKGGHSSGGGAEGAAGLAKGNRGGNGGRTAAQPTDRSSKEAATAVAAATAASSSSARNAKGGKGTGNQPNKGDKNARGGRGSDPNTGGRSGGGGGGGGQSGKQGGNASNSTPAASAGATAGGGAAAGVSVGTSTSDGKRQPRADAGRKTAGNPGSGSKPAQASTATTEATAASSGSPTGKETESGGRKNAGGNRGKGRNSSNQGSGSTLASTPGTQGGSSGDTADGSRGGATSGQAKAASSKDGGNQRSKAIVIPSSAGSAASLGEALQRGGAKTTRVQD